MLPPIPDETTFEFRGDVQNVMPGMIPRIYNRSYAITADLVIPPEGAEGVIVAEADHLGGFTLYVKDGKLTHTYSMMGVFTFTQVAEEDLPSGDVTVRMEFAADDATPATGGEVTLYIDDRPVGKGRMDHTVPVRFSGYAGMDIGRDNGGVVDRRLRGPQALPVHRHHQEGDLRHQAPPVRTGRARPPRRCAPRPHRPEPVRLTIGSRTIATYSISLWTCPGHRALPPNAGTATFVSLADRHSEHPSVGSRIAFWNVNDGRKVTPHVGRGPLESRRAQEADFSELQQVRVLLKLMDERVGRTGSVGSRWPAQAF